MVDYSCDFWGHNVSTASSHWCGSPASFFWISWYSRASNLSSITLGLLKWYMTEGSHFTIHPESSDIAIRVNLSLFFTPSKNIFPSASYLWLNHLYCFYIRWVTTFLDWIQCLEREIGLFHCLIFCIALLTQWLKNYFPFLCVGFKIWKQDHLFL